MAIGKRFTLILWFIGIAAFVGLTVWAGAGLVGQAVVSVGWGTFLVVLARAVAVFGAGVGWWLLFPRALRPAGWNCVLIRFIREATNALLPLAQIGGDFIGARCLALCGAKGTVAAASVIVDVLAQATTQLVFAVVGVLLLVASGGNELAAWPIATGIAVAVPALGGFFIAQGAGGQRILKKLLSFFASDRKWLAVGEIDDLFARFKVFYSYHDGLLPGWSVHLAVWFVGAAEVWIALSFMGYPVSYEQAVVIESLMHAARGAAFAVPGALGVQEGGLIVLCALYGAPPEAALALSLVKRIPDLVLGAPGLIAWQAMEGRRFFSAPSASGNENERA
ncbi:MAG: flippase-like domain-containing protein [Methylocystis sp.]|nr:flippase-like domain-containing protein [Methylocystis sp.]